MTYRAGIGRGMFALTGLEEGPPHIRCDGCGLKLEARTKSGSAPMWLLKNHAPKGWKLVRHEDPQTGVVLREDYCPGCRQMQDVMDSVLSRAKHGVRIRGGIAVEGTTTRFYARICVWQNTEGTGPCTEYTDGHRFGTEREAQEHYQRKFEPILQNIAEKLRTMSEVTEVAGRQGDL